MLIFVGFSYGLVVPLFAIVLTIVVPIFCVLGSVASYRRARQHRAMLSPSELLSTSSPSHRCPACWPPGISRQSLTFYGLYHP
jgi:hypothetical protein